MNAQRKLIFLHLPKTGGSSVVNALHQIYGLEHSQLVLADDDPALDQAIEAEKPFIHGHISVKGLHKAQAWYTATVLRDPVDRVVSRYVHLVFGAHDNLKAEREKYQNFEDYLESTYANNWQCQMLCGEWHQPISPALFDKACEEMNKLDWVGTQDRLAEAMLDLQKRLGFATRYKPRTNLRRSQEMWLEIKSRYAAAIADRNQYDRKLYEQAQQIYSQRRQLSLIERLRLKLEDLLMKD
jgi:hypothetical protein